jgi:hypothetical protein
MDGFGASISAFHEIQPVCFIPIVKLCNVKQLIIAKAQRLGSTQL